jgi:hypothetical protein
VTVDSVATVLDENFTDLAIGTDAVQHGDELMVSDSNGQTTAIPISQNGDIVIGKTDVAIALDGDVTNGGVSDGRIIQPETHQATDTVIVPQANGGVEVFYVLNDENAPNQFYATLDLPQGAILTKYNDQVLVVEDNDNSPLFYVSAPWALDAVGQHIALRLDVANENQVVLSVSHDAEINVVYPVLVDPYYDTVWGTVSEIAWCATQWIAGACSRAKTSAQDALSYAEQYFPGTTHNGRGDAFRHCYWSARMTIEDGAGTAERIATHHEDTESGQPAIERTMDLSNNDIGRSVGGDKGKNTETYVRSTCKSKASGNGLWIIVNGKLQ